MTVELSENSKAVQVNYLILTLTTRCNLRCSYCYHGDPKKRLDMESATLERAFVLAASGTGPLHIQLTGGEPCLVPHLIEAAGRMAQQLQRPYTMAMQTNGTCINQDIIGLIRQFRLQVGVSLDGSPRLQEILRGRATETLNGLMLLEAEQIPFRVTTVVNDRNADQLDRLAWLLAAFRQARGIGLDLLVVKGNAVTHADAPCPTTAGQLVRGIEALVKALMAINRRRESPLRLREWDLVRRMLALPEHSIRSFCQAGIGASLAVHPDGRCFPCGQTLGDDRFATNIGDSVLPILLTPHLVARQEDCGNCPLVHRCPNDCPSRLFYNPPPSQRLACELYRVLANFCLGENGTDRTPMGIPVDGLDRRKPCCP